MGLVLNFQICQVNGCSQLQFTETTGIYNAISNPGGYGSPNPLTSDALTAILIITLANGSSYNIDLFATGNFPTSDNTFIYNITNENIGYITSNAIPDQIITFTYIVTTASQTYTQTVQQGLYCQVECCINTMFVNLDFGCSECFTHSIENALKAFALLQGLITSANCGSNTNFQNILNQLNKLCAGTGCSSCN